VFQIPLSLLVAVCGPLLIGSFANAATCTTKCSVPISSILATHVGMFTTPEERSDFTNYCSSLNPTAYVSRTSDYDPSHGSVMYDICTKSEKASKQATGFGFGDGFEARQLSRQKCLDSLPQMDSLRTGGFMLAGSPESQEPVCY
jgi:hypothetical protein